MEEAWRGLSGSATSSGSIRSSGASGEGPRAGYAGSSGDPPPDAHSAERSGESFREALADDFNTPRAFAAVFELVGEGNLARSGARRRPSRSCCRCSASSSLLRPDQGERPTRRRRGCSWIGEEARAAKDFDRADAIRDQLAELGWEVRDGPRAQLVPRA